MRFGFGFKELAGICGLASITFPLGVSKGPGCAWLGGFVGFDKSLLRADGFIESFAISIGFEILGFGSCTAGAFTSSMFELELGFSDDGCRQILSSR